MAIRGQIGLVDGHIGLLDGPLGGVYQNRLLARKVYDAAILGTV